jgi:hypothetical protein
MARHLSEKQIAAGFGGKAAKSRKSRSGGGSRKGKGKGKKSQRAFTVRALDIAAAGVMLEKLNAASVASRAVAVSQGQMHVGDALMGAAHDVYVGAKSNWPTLLLVPAGLALVRQNVPTRTIKVPVLPLRVGA